MDDWIWKYYVRQLLEVHNTSSNTDGQLFVQVLGTFLYKCYNIFYWKYSWQNIWEMYRTVNVWHIQGHTSYRDQCTYVLQLQQQQQQQQQQY